MSRTAFRSNVMASAIALASLLVATAHPVAAGSPADRAPLVSLSGANSRIVKPGFHRITSRKAWEELWKQHTGKAVTTFGDRSGMPQVNFDDCMVIAIFSGSSLTNDGVSVTSVSENSDKITLRYSNRYFQIGMPDAAAKARAAKNGAFGIVVIPRSAKPVVIKESVVRRMGETPVPMVRAELP